MNTDTKQPNAESKPDNQGFLLRFVKPFLKWPYFFLVLFTFNLGAAFFCLMVNFYEFETELSFWSCLIVAMMGVIFAIVAIHDDNSA